MSGTSQHVDTAAERFVALRKALGLTQEDLVRGADSTQRHAISKIENGTNQLTGAKLLRVCARAVGLSMEQLQDYIEGVSSLADTLPLCRPPSSGPLRPPSVPPPAEWFEVDEETRRVATLYLRQKPYPLEPEAIIEAFRRLRIQSADAARDPEQVANAVRLHVGGVTATAPGYPPSSPAPAGTRRSAKR
jgi:transcriptional regulator with XRE-family HTH domain